MAELADALDSGSSDYYNRTGSSPVAGTILKFLKIFAVFIIEAVVRAMVMQDEVPYPFAVDIRRDEYREELQRRVKAYSAHRN